jgi:hypothetical protein
MPTSHIIYQIHGKPEELGAKKVPLCGCLHVGIDKRILKGNNVRYLNICERAS